MFNSNRPGNNLFGNNNQVQGNNLFGNNNQPQGNNVFGNQGNNMLSNQTPNNMFNNQAQVKNIFNQQQQGGNTQGNIFNNPGSNNNMFGNNTNQGNTMFNNPNQGNTMFNNPNQGNTMFNNPNQGNTMLGNQGNRMFANTSQGQGNNLFNVQQNQMNQMNQNLNLNNPNLVNQGHHFFQPLNELQIRQNDVRQFKMVIQDLLANLDNIKLQTICIDNANYYKNTPLNQLPDNLQKGIMVLMNNMLQLKNYLQNIKKQSQEIDKKSQQYCRNVRDKLYKYKQCLLYNLSQNKMIQQVKQDIQMIDKQIQNNLIPMYNTLKQSNIRQHHFNKPDDFTVHISKKILNKMIELNNKIDQIIYCNQANNEELSQQTYDTITVLQQLLAYYQNISARVFQFIQNYNRIKTIKLNKIKGRWEVQEIMKQIDNKVQEKMNKNFKAYDLIQKIETIVIKKQKQQIEKQKKRTQLVG